MRVVITGGFGFLGRHLIDALLADGRGPVVATDLAGSPAVRRPEAAYVGGVDVLDPDTVRSAVAGADAVIHLAGLVSFWAADRDRLYAVNQGGTRNVAEACARAGVKRLLHVSSVAAIGFDGREDHPVDETHVFDPALAAGKHYMLSKRAAEGELAAASRAGVSVAVANPGALYGPGDRTNLALFRAVHAERLPLLFPGGTNVVDVRDVARGLVLLLHADVRSERLILGGYNLRFTEIVRTMARVMRVSTAPRRVPPFFHGAFHRGARWVERVSPRRPALTGDHVDAAFRFRYFSSARAARLLGWRARIPFPRTLAEAYAELAESGLLQVRGPAPTPAVRAPETAPAPAS